MSNDLYELRTDTHARTYIHNHRVQNLYTFAIAKWENQERRMETNKRIE